MLELNDPLDAETDQAASGDSPTEADKDPEAPSSETGDSPKKQKAGKGKSKADIQRRAYALEQKLHTADLSQKIRHSLWCSPLVFDMIGLIAEQLGIPKSDVVHMAAIMFYRQCFSDERRMLNDLGMLLNNLECQAEELEMEIQSLEDTALSAVELELSPYKGSEYFDE